MKPREEVEISVARIFYRADSTDREVADEQYADWPSFDSDAFDAMPDESLVALVRALANKTKEFRT